MGNQQELNKIVLDICKNAMEGTLKLEYFSRIWPEDASVNQLFKQIYDDIEDGIEHIPGFWFSHKIDYKSWYKSDEYLMLYLDSLLLAYNKDMVELMKCREIVLKQKRLSKELIESKVKECLG